MRVGICVNRSLCNRRLHKCDSSLNCTLGNRKTVRNLNVAHLRMRQIEANFVDLAEFEYQKCAKLKKNSPIWLNLFAQFKKKLYLCSGF